jgi:hypothetical protein
MSVSPRTPYDFSAPQELLEFFSFVTRASRAAQPILILCTAQSTQIGPTRCLLVGNLIIDFSFNYSVSKSINLSVSFKGLVEQK